MSGGGKEGAGGGTYSSLAEFLAHAYVMETDAEERYRVLADQMEVHNNTEVAELFRTLEKVEGRHAQEILDQAGDVKLPHIAPWDFHWPDDDSPEAPDAMEAHYLMTPHHALRIALGGEERALRFFDDVAAAATDPEIREAASKFADEDREHVRQVRDLLAKYPRPEEGWADDPDPPITPE